jgi:putative SOS response-associated peptidase YedK
MCGRYSNTRGKSDEVTRRLAELLRVPQPQTDLGFERFNVAPTDPVVAAVDDDQGRRLETLRWGLQRHWTKDDKTRFLMINARAETIMERRAYRDLVEQSQHRCLVLADGWYEWQKPEDPRQPRRPMRFSLPGDEPFAFAGLWTGDTCTIVTCEANELARPVHDRMPVVLDGAPAWEAWLDPALDGAAASELLNPLPAEQLRVRPASPLVNSVANDGPECLDPAAPLDAQLQLSGT